MLHNPYHDSQKRKTTSQYGQVSMDEFFIGANEVSESYEDGEPDRRSGEG